MKKIPHEVVKWGGDQESALLLGDRVTWAKGTRARQGELEGVLTGKAALKMGIARLVHEATNEHDPNAVAVLMGRERMEKVGYLSRELAAEMAESIDALAAASGNAPTCLAAITKIGAFGDRAWAVKLLGPWPTKFSWEMSRDTGVIEEMEGELASARSAFSEADATVGAIADELRALRASEAGSARLMRDGAQHIDYLNHQLAVARDELNRVRMTPPRSSSGAGTAVLCIVLGALFGGCGVAACSGSRHEGARTDVASAAIPSESSPSAALIPPTISASAAATSRSRSTVRTKQSVDASVDPAAGY